MLPLMTFYHINTILSYLYKNDKKNNSRTIFQLTIPFCNIICYNGEVHKKRKGESLMKGLKTYIAGLLTGLLFISVPIFADSYTKAIDALVNFTTVKVNGVAVSSDNFVVDGKTYVWIRDVANMFDKKTIWDENTNTANIVDATYYIPTEDDLKPVATVNGTEIPVADFVSMAKQADPKKTKDEIKKTALDNLINMSVVVSEASKLGITFNDEVMKKANDETTQIRKTYGAQFTQFLTQTKMNDEMFAKNRAISIIQQDFIAQLKVTNPITDEQALATYNANKDKFLKATTKHILLKTTDDQGAPLSDDKIKAVKAQADKLTAELKKGANFDEYMKKYSQDTGSKDKIEGFEVTKGQTVPEYETAAFTQEINKLYDPIKSQFGYHIVLVTKREPAAFDTVKAECSDIAFGEWYTKQIEIWKTAATINIDKAIYDGIKLD